MRHKKERPEWLAAMRKDFGLLKELESIA